MPRYRAVERAAILTEQRTALVAIVVHEASVGRAAELPSRVLPAEPADLRGIPVVGRGVGGVSPGTHPERETLKRSESAAA